MKVHYVVSSGYHYAPVIHWRRVGRSLHQRYGPGFILTLLNVLDQYVAELSKSDEKHAIAVQQGLLEIRMSWFTYVASPDEKQMPNQKLVTKVTSE